MVASCLREEELTRRDTQKAVMTRGRYYLASVEESEEQNANMAMDVPIEEDHEQELAEAWDDIDGQELEPEVVRKARALEMEWYRKMECVREKTHRRVLRKDQRSRPSR